MSPTPGGGGPPRDDDAPEGGGPGAQGEPVGSLGEEAA